MLMTMDPPWSSIGTGSWISMVNQWHMFVRRSTSWTLWKSRNQTHHMLCFFVVFCCVFIAWYFTNAYVLHVCENALPELPVCWNSLPASLLFKMFLSWSVKVEWSNLYEETKFLLFYSMFMLLCLVCNWCTYYCVDYHLLTFLLFMLVHMLNLYSQCKYSCQSKFHVCDNKVLIYLLAYLLYLLNSFLPWNLFEWSISKSR